MYPDLVTEYESIFPTNWTLILSGTANTGWSSAYMRMCRVGSTP